jgi:hypothetical protein
MNTQLMKSRLVLLALSVTAVQFAIAQEVDPYTSGADRKAKPGIEAKQERPVNVEVRYETFSLPLSEAAALSREVLPDSKLYERLLKMISEGKARQERFTMIRTISGHRGVSEAISETIYPTEYDAPGLPDTVGIQMSPPRGKDTPASVPDLDKLNRAPRAEDLDSVRTPATPTAFETRNLGHTLEVEPNLGADRKTLDLRIAPESVLLAGQSTHGQGLSTAAMPEFETQRLMVAVNVAAGVPHLIGTVNRPPHSTVDPNSANTTWFAFVTARPVIPE